MSPAQFPTITGAHWREMFAAHRRQAAIEGNSMMLQIRAAMRQKFGAVTGQPDVAERFRNLGVSPARRPAPSNFTVAGSLAGERSAGDRREAGVFLEIPNAEAGDGEPLNQSMHAASQSAPVQTCENAAAVMCGAVAEPTSFSVTK